MESLVILFHQDGERCVKYEDSQEAVASHYLQEVGVGKRERMLLSVLFTFVLLEYYHYTHLFFKMK